VQVSGATSTGDLYASSQLQQSRDDAGALEQSLGQGDLTGAQKAYAALQLTLANGGTAQAGTSGTYGAVQTDFAALGQALQSGDLSGAQKIFAQLQKDVQNAPPTQHHRHRHHHHESEGGEGQGGKSNASTRGQSAVNIDLSVNALQYTAPGISVTEVDVSVGISVSSTVGNAVDLRA